MAAFKKRFVDYYAHEQQAAYKDRHQKDGESVADFSNDIARLMTKAKVDPVVRLHTYLNNLHATISHQVTIQNPATMMEAETMARTVESLFENANRYKLKQTKAPKTQTVSETDRDDQLIKRLAERLMSLQVQESVASITPAPAKHKNRHRKPRNQRNEGTEGEAPSSNAAKQDIMDLAAVYGHKTPTQQFLSVPNPVWQGPSSNQQQSSAANQNSHQGNC